MAEELDVQAFQGRAVRTWDGQHIGVLDRVLIDPVDGLPLFGVVALPATLGFTKRLHPVPWLLFSTKPGAAEVILNLPPRCLSDSPVIKREEDGLDDDFRRVVYDHFDQAACVRPVQSAGDEGEPPVEPPAARSLG